MENANTEQSLQRIADSLERIEKILEKRFKPIDEADLERAFAQIRETAKSSSEQLLKDVEAHLGRPIDSE